MKQLLNFLISGVLLSAGVGMAMANPVAPELTIEKLDNAYKMVRVSVSGLKETALIAVMDHHQQSVLEVEAPSTEPFSKVLDFSRMPTGSFFLSIRTENRETVQPLRITSADVILYEGRRMEYFAPTYRLQARQLDINWFNTQVAQLDISLSEWTGAVIFKQQLRNVIKVEKRYDLSKLPKGKYVLTLKTTRKSWNHLIEIP